MDCEMPQRSVVTTYLLEFSEAEGDRFVSMLRNGWREREVEEMVWKQ